MLSNRALNRNYMVLLYSALGWGGSVFSVLTVGAIAFSGAKMALRRLSLPRDPPVLSMGLAGLAYYVSGLAMIVTNPFDQANYWLAIERLPFLGFTLLFAQITLLEARQLREALELGAAIGAFGLLGWALWEWMSLPFYTPYFRVHGAPGNPGPYATTAAFLFAVCLAAALRPRARWQWLYVISSLSAAAALSMSGLRTLYPVLIMFPLLMVFAFPRDGSGIDRKRLIWLAVGTVILVAPVAIYVISSRLADLVALLEATGLSPTADNSVGQRIGLWYCAADAFARSPIFGLGQSDAHVFMRQCTNALIGQPLSFSHYHNALATAAAFGGIVEVAATAALLLVPLFWCWRYRKVLDARYAVVLMTSILTVYGLNGFSNLMLGHDIHDALYVHAMSVALSLLVGRELIQEDQEAAQRGHP